MSNKIQQYTVYLYLQTAVRVSGGISTHHQEILSLYVQYPALLSLQRTKVLVNVYVILNVIQIGWLFFNTSHSKVQTQYNNTPNLRSLMKTVNTIGAEYINFHVGHVKSRT